MSRAGATGSGVACWTVASDSRRDITLISTVLKKDLAQLNAGQDIETREKALLVAETQLAARRRAEQRRIIGEARTALGPDSGTAAVDWRATAFDDNETLVSSDAEFLRGVNCELVKIALREITRKAACSCGEAFHACRRADADDSVGESLHSVASLSISIASANLRERKKITHAAIDRFRASTAALAAASTAAERELVARRERFQDIIDFCKELAPRGEWPTMPAVLSRDALADLLEAASFHEEAREEDLATIEAYAGRIRTVFDAAGTRPPASRLGHGVDADDATRPATIERYVDALALGGTGGGGGGLPFYPPVDLSRVISREGTWLRPTRRRYRYWSSRWREVKTCPICWDALPRAETASGCLGRSAEKDLGLCAHFNDVCLECTRAHCKEQLGDAARVTGAGLACMMSSCTVPLKLAALGAQWSVKKYAGEDPGGVETDRLLGQSDCAKARRFIRAAKMTAKGVACWCPNPACDEVIDLLSAMPICKVCACEVCKSCYQKKHAGPCAVAADSSSLKLCRDNFQKCPRCKAVVEKKMACDHMRCRCGQTFCYRRGARATGVPWSASGRASSTRARRSAR